MKTALLTVLFVLAAWPQKLHEVCAACHNQHLEDFQTHAHFAKGLSCDACHGPSKGHREATGNQPPDRVAGPVEQPALCGTCHSGPRKGYEASKHGKIVLSRSGKAAACTTCHGTHAPRKPAAMAMQCGRCHESLPESCRKDPPVAAKLACAGCHDPHSLSAKR